MRYTDCELFDHPSKVLDGIKRKMTFNQFCKWAIFRLNVLVIESTKQKDWLRSDINHLRNYRTKAAEFYRKKDGKR